MLIDTISAMDLRIDDLRGAATISPLEGHRKKMFEHSPPESVHALDLDVMRQPEITLWSAWEGDALLGCGALKELNAKQAELKSMRAADGYLRKGVAAHLLEHIIAVACSRHYRQL